MPEPTFTTLINGEPQELPTGCTVDAMLALLGVAGRRVAVAVNRGVVPRSTFHTRQIAAGDRIEILEAVGGG